jgi:hypothetical protein
MSSASFVRDWVNISLEKRETLFPSSWNKNSDLKQQRHTHTVVHVCWSISQKATFHVEAGKIRKRKKGPPFIQGPSAWPLTRFFSEKHPNANASAAASFWFNYFSPSAKMWWDKFVFSCYLYTTFAAFVLTLKAKELTSFFLRGQHSIFCVCQFFFALPKTKVKTDSAAGTTSISRWLIQPWIFFSIPKKKTNFSISLVNFNKNMK